jgi:hypothetical protein
VWLSRWLHRRCVRELEELTAQHREWVRDNKAQWGAKNKAISEAANERIALAAAEARERVAAAHASVAEQVRQRTEHAVRTAAMRTAAEYRAEREAAYAQGVADGRAEALRDGPPVVATGELAALLTATPRDGTCTKIRLNDHAHAEAMVAHVLETSGVRTEPYTCPVCPRQLFDRGRFWHVRTIDDPAEQAKRDAMKNGKAKGRPDRLALRLPPEQIRLMNERARGSVDDSGVAQFGSAAGS